ncbi:MAG: tripartite tricarboxylate transporter permease [Arenicellales bacterium]|jgi:putative tricarboxylic transport membrane protein|nr:tripartite tricarboxylate transporter permease [Arenicellales bacterium]
MEIFLSALETLWRLDVILALLVGAVGGVIIGAIPGVGPAVAIAILLPATFSMEPIVGLTLLLGIYGASMYGGAIPAILINTPGTPVNALTTYDGHAMTRQGQAGRALSLAYSASFFGGIFSVICLVTLSPYIAKVAPLFGSRDILMAALLGMILVIIAHRGKTFAAGMLVFFGMFLDTVGMESVRYTKRFTFDQSWLLSGFDLIVVLLGLFALSQAFVLLVGRDRKTQVASVSGKLFSGMAELFRYKRVAVCSSSFGVIMGIIPGVGEFLAQFFSYTLAQNLSKEPQRFGHGSPEGLIASESANNAVPAAAMIPLLALGIPGEALTAMMLSVFYVHSIIPGPALFQTQPDFLVTLYLCLFLVNILVLVVLMMTTNTLLKVINVPGRFLGACILVLSFVGVYSLRNSIIDCAVCAVFGLIGYILKRLKLPLVPIILGMVLGGIMEQRFRASLARIETPLDFINRPVSGTIFAIIIIALIAHGVALIRARNKRLLNPGI